MSAFLDPLIVQEISDSIFQTTQVFRYQSDIAGLITVPALFFTDFASVPRIGIIYAMLGDCAHEPAVVHDFCYYTGTLTRKMSDDVLLEAMEVIGMAALSNLVGGPRRGLVRLERSPEERRSTQREV